MLSGWLVSKLGERYSLVGYGGNCTGRSVQPPLLEDDAVVPSSACLFSGPHGVWATGSSGE